MNKKISCTIIKNVIRQNSYKYFNELAQTLLFNIGVDNVFKLLLLLLENEINAD